MQTVTYLQFRELGEKVVLEIVISATASKLSYILVSEEFHYFD